jgi:hypothetical protein
MAIAKCLDLSISHVPTTDHSGYPLFKSLFGNHRYCVADYGFVVFPCLDDVQDDTNPKWLIPILEKAKKSNCILINFDMDAPVDKTLKTYE